VPQLDAIVYSSEVLVLVFTFIILYIFLVERGLPFIFKTLYIRKIKLSGLKTKIIFSDKESYFLENISDHQWLLHLDLIKELSFKVRSIMEEEVFIFNNIVIEDEIIKDYELYFIKYHEMLDTLNKE
jgi:hypothetical protein